MYILEQHGLQIRAEKDPIICIIVQEIILQALFRKKIFRQILGHGTLSG